MSESDLDSFRAAPLWSWNDLMEPDACAAHVERLAAGGFGGAYAHTRLGMLIPFLGEQYLACLKASVERARSLGFRLNLYDEDRWPSGWAGGAVPLASKDYRLKALVRRPADEPLMPDYEPLLTHNGFQYSIWTMPLGHAKFSGTCYVDLTNSAAVACFLQHAFAPLADAVEEHFGDAVEAIFSDEPALAYLYSWESGGVPWSRELPARLREHSDEPLADVLASLFDDGADAPRRRLLYYRELAALFDGAFMQQVAAWRRRRGVAWTGHFMYEHSLPLHFSWGVNCHGSYRRFDWPGIDHLGRQVGEVVTALGCRTAVHQFSKPRMMSELFGASGQNLSFADRKWIAEQQIVLGANHLVPHVSSTSLAGARKRDYPPTISPHQPWWPLNRHFEDHCARLCAVMARGRGTPELLVIHPQETVMARSRGPVALSSQPAWETRFFCQSNDETLNTLDQRWKHLCHALLDASYVFDFGDEGLLAEYGTIDEDGSKPPRLRVGDATYAGVLIPELETLRRTTVELLTRFVKRGGMVACVGRGPTQVDGDSRAAVAPIDRLLDSLPIRGGCADEAVQALAATLPPEIRLIVRDSPAGRIWRYTRVAGNHRITLLANVDRLRRRTVEVRWTQAPPADALAWPTHAAEAMPMKLVDGSATLALEPGGSTVIVENTAEGLPVRVSPGSHRGPSREVSLEDLTWRITQLDPNALALDFALWRRKGERWQGPHCVLAIKDFLDRQRYDGPLDLQYALPSMTALPSDACLKAVFENDDDRHEALFNGNLLQATEADSWTLGGRGFYNIELPVESCTGSDSLMLRYGRFRHCDPTRMLELDRRLGTPLEALILTGEFSVFGVEGTGPQEWSGQIEYHTGEPLSRWLPTQRLRYLAAPWRLSPPAPLAGGDVTGQGLPFYAGRIRYEAELPLDERPAGQLRLVLDRLAAPAADVAVNGRRLGALAWPPFTIDVSDAVQVGVNRIEITVYQSLRNLLGPHHHPTGEPVYVNPESFRPLGVANWMETLLNGRQPEGWRPDYCFVEFGLFAPRTAPADAMPRAERANR